MTIEEKIANAESTDWVREGMTDEEVSQIVTEAKEDARERLSLDEMIKHCEEVAEEKEGMCEYNLNCSHFQYVEWKRCANEHRQLAEWLKELKEYRKNYTCFNCYNSSASFSDYPCCECRRCFKALDGIKDHYEEVNADE